MTVQKELGRRFNVQTTKALRVYIILDMFEVGLAAGQPIFN